MPVSTAQVGIDKNKWEIRKMSSKLFFNTNELAHKLSVTPGTIYRWVSEGMPVHHKDGRLFIYNIVDVEEWHNNYINMLKNKSILKMQKIKNTKVSLYRCKYDYLSDIEFKDYFKTVINKLNSLDSREREIPELHYGIGNSRSYSFREIGKIFEISRERVRQIENNAITKLRKSMQDRT